MATAKPVRPAPVPQVYTPVPQRSDRANFAERGDKMMTSFPPTVDGINRGVDYVNQAVDYADGAASAVQQQWGLVEQGVRDTQAALAAIKNGPVASVNGRSGIVSELVEGSVTRIYGKADRMSDAPLFTWISYDTVTGRGADWPPVPASQQFGYWLVFTYGSIFNGVIRLHQTATQVYTQGGQGQKFERVKQDATWSEWDRVITGRFVVEAEVGGSISGPTYLLDPRAAPIHQKALAANTTIQLPEPLTGGDQVTLFLYQTGNFSVAFSANVALPIGRTMPAIGSGEMLPISFVPKYSGANKWYALIGERYSQ